MSIPGVPSTASVGPTRIRLLAILRVAGTMLLCPFVRVSQRSKHGNEPTFSSISTGTKTIPKIRIRILPYLFLLYVISYLDRINIGFAALTMNKELAITSQQFGLLVGIFFFGYFLFEIPSNLMLHRIGARVWIARILISWGIVAMLSGLSRNVSQLYVARFLLGLAEAGYFPGIVLYLTYWFRLREQAQAIALFLTGLPVTSILGAPVSGFILDHVHWLGVSSWRWLLVLEGIPAVACGVLTYFVLPGRPAEAKFLTEDEKHWITEELDQEERQKMGAHKISAVEAMTNGRVWHLACIGFTLNIGMYSLSFWSAGRCRPHPRHWQAPTELAGVSDPRHADSTGR